MTIRHVLVGTNESEEAAAAARWAGAVARMCAADLTFVEAAAESAEQTPERSDELRAEGAARVARWLADDAPTRQPTVYVERGDVVPALAAKADEVHADLVVIGSRSVEGVTGLALGSVVHELAHRLSCPVVAVPVSEAPVGFGCIVVGVDGSVASEIGLRWAEALAQPLGATLCAVYGIDDLYETFNANGPLGKDEHGAQAEVRRERSRIDIDFIERTAPHPADALREVAIERGAGLLVVSAKERWSLGGMRLGATPDRLIHRPPCPVAVLPHKFIHAEEAVTASATSARS